MARGQGVNKDGWLWARNLRKVVGRRRPVKEVLRVKSMGDVHGKLRAQLASRDRSVGCSNHQPPLTPALQMKKLRHREIKLLA